MKKSGLICRILCLLLVLLFVIPASATSTVDDLSVTQGCHSIDARIPMLEVSEEVTNFYSAFLYDNTNNKLLYAVDPDRKLPPASLVKIMTGLIIAEKGNMDDIITVRQDILDTIPENSFGVDLKSGETISLRDLLYCIMVESANEAAAVAADHVSGNIDTFVKEMNDYAARLGCTNTFFTNVHGIHDDRQVSTARDLARILSAASQNELFMHAFSTVNYTVAATNMSEARELSSSNHLMNDDMMTIYLDSRVTGGRTGSMNTGERNLAVTAERNGVQLISIVLGSLSELGAGGKTTTFGSFNETSALLDLGFKGHHSVQLFYENQALKQYAVENGDSYISTGVKDAVFALLPYGVTYEELSIRYNENTTTIYAPVKTDEEISTVQVWYNDICLAQANLYALHDVNVKQNSSTEEAIEDDHASGFAILVVVTIIIVLLSVLLFGRRMIFRMIRKHQLRRHRRNRRRSR